MNKIIYSGIFFNSETKNSLKFLAQQTFISLFENIKLDHITLFYGQDEIFEYGKEIKFDVIGYFKDNDCQVFSVSLSENVPNPQNKSYHITVSHTNNVSPKYSNEVISKTKFYSFDKPLTFIGKIGKYTKKGIVYE